jgi:MurNAc alpha-1-phosphate uridylyltransferase
MQAMIVAAGYGKRMRSIGEDIPKPLVKVDDYSLIEHNIKKLAQAGFTDIVINVSYLADKITAALGNGQAYGVNITYSHEPQPLGWGGGVLKALPLFNNKPFIVVSCDLWTNYPFQQLALPADRLAHLVLVDNPDYHRDFDLTDSGRVIIQSQYTYAGIGIFDPKLFADLPDDTFSFGEVIRPAIKNKWVSGECYRGDWFNIGSPSCLSKLQQYLKKAD